MSSKIVPEKHSDPAKYRRHTSGETLLALIFVVGISSGLFLIAANHEFVKKQLAIGFSIITASCLPGWLYFRSRKSGGVGGQSINGAIANDFIIRANKSRGKPLAKGQSIRKTLSRIFYWTFFLFGTLFFFLNAWKFYSTGCLIGKAKMAMCDGQAISGMGFYFSTFVLVPSWYLFWQPKPNVPKEPSQE